MLLIVLNSNRGDFYDGNRVVSLVEFKVGRFL